MFERNYREKLKEEVNIPNLKFKSILFSAKSVKGLHDLAQTNEVILLGSDELVNILQLVKNGDVDKAREMILKESTGL